MRGRTAISVFGYDVGMGYPWVKPALKSRQFYSVVNNPDQEVERKAKKLDDQAKAYRKASRGADMDSLTLQQAGTPTHELQRLGGWRTGAMVERYAHLAPDHLVEAASRLNSVLPGYDSATVA